MTRDTSLFQRIRGHLDQHPRLTLDLTSPSASHVTKRPLIRAAVVILICPDAADTPCFVITKRQRGLRKHSGQWALPGGRVDVGESIVDAGLREVGEEIGVTLAPHSVVGKLDDYETRSGFIISPLVCWSQETLEMTASEEEVARIHLVPLEDLGDDNQPILETIEQSTRPVLSMEFATLGTQIFAPTAAVLFQFREVALAGRTTRIDGFEQPPWAWK